MDYNQYRRKELTGRAVILREAYHGYPPGTRFVIVSKYRGLNLALPEDPDRIIVLRAVRCERVTLEPQPGDPVPQPSYKQLVAALQAADEKLRYLRQLNDTPGSDNARKIVVLSWFDKWRPKVESVLQKAK